MKNQNLSIDHIGIAVRDLTEALELYNKSLPTSVTEIEDLKEHGVRLCFLNFPGTRVELLEPTNKESRIGKFIEKHGPGLHHICYRVDNLESALEDYKKLGHTLLDTKPRPGAKGTIIAFVDPKSFDGVLVELLQHVG